MSDNITLPREVVEKALEALGKGVTFKPGWVPECEDAVTALRTALAAPKQEPEQKQKPVAWFLPQPLAVEHFYAENQALKREAEALRRDAERLKAVALQAQNAAIDLAKENERMAAPRPEGITAPKTVPLPRITCGFNDVRFDGERWFCGMCRERMPEDYEQSVKHYSGEKDYLELMRRKAEAVSAKGKRVTP